MPPPLLPSRKTYKDDKRVTSANLAGLVKPENTTAMSKETFAESLPKEAGKYLAGAILGLLGKMGLDVWSEAGSPILTAIETALSKRVLLQAVFALLTVTLVSWIVFWILRPKKEIPLTLKYKFVPYGGYYLDSKSGEAICPRCLAEGNIIHMMNIGNSRMCNACQCACRGEP